MEAWQEHVQEEIFQINANMVAGHTIQEVQARLLKLAGSLETGADDLSGADKGEFDDKIAINTSGQFAAAWNSLDEGDREQFWESLKNQLVIAEDCVQQDHRSLLLLAVLATGLGKRP